MTHPILEKAARAMWEAREATMPERVRQPWTVGTHVARSTTGAMLVAALEAIREPSEEMRAAGKRALVAAYDKDEPFEPAPDIWQAMIDTILTSGEGEP
jgi:hypothetical protein